MDIYDGYIYIYIYIIYIVWRWCGDLEFASFERHADIELRVSMEVGGKKEGGKGSADVQKCRSKERRKDGKTVPPVSSCCDNGGHIKYWPTRCQHTTPRKPAPIPPQVAVW
jgi:hypothetical protein